MPADKPPFRFQKPGPVDVPEHDPWVFGYGSLMWKPGFDYEERAEATLIGAHRTLCIYSFHHRGTPEQPGLVLGLDLGGSCRGIAFRVAAARWPETHAYLTEREQISGVYRETRRRVRLRGASVTDASAVAYVANRAHPQYASGLSREDQLHLVRRSHGLSGPNTDYVLATVDALAEMGITDPGLGWMAQRLRSGHG
ncbi:gamma-glutamylcyclotransferase [Azorhizobium oxalatiphilum]|uniref:glutathione-specific gamma-glutamylcyclotransferase n=1 Tax=Azorhizobium oxalatiphilum TaxID=980631 RepID=A0A917C7M6_9HYPH|nr:gamma-glutamylcyclotransferase [Azorhizobium oxalatiphilum]GGF76221.1 gamma-glutamylcyclotransferase [Azorhizobium oxalatiphilum]